MNLKCMKKLKKQKNDGGDNDEFKNTADPLNIARLPQRYNDISIDTHGLDNIRNR